MSPDPKRELLRHLVATIAFRGRVAIDGSPAGFADFRAGETSRTPCEILAHLGDLLYGSKILLSGEYKELGSQPLPWLEEIERFRGGIRELDAFLSSERPLAHSPEKMVQGPIGDALTHVGQIVYLRRLAGFPVDPKPYFTEDIVAGNFN